ncbi:hypothetical protein [Deinococcus hohokamensis]|uniref:Uncharacterized protein n=1 Tax=Deinococcus hohokamensis TaxID=309883 RepID=A0ABV9I4B8_9DEIO
MTKAMTAAQKDALMSEAAALGLEVTRTSKEFFFNHPKSGKRRVTPGEIRGLIAETEDLARAEALEAANEIRAQEEAGVVVESEVPAAPQVEVEAAPAEPQPAPTEPQAPAADVKPVKKAKAPKVEQSARVVLKYGPPCGGDIAHLSVATHAEARNPLMHVQAKPAATYKNKEEAAAAGRRLKGTGWIAFLAHADGEQFWALATLADGQLTLDGQPVALQLLEGQAAEVARAKVKAARLQAKSQWQVQAA